MLCDFQPEADTSRCLPPLLGRRIAVLNHKIKHARREKKGFTQNLSTLKTPPGSCLKRDLPHVEVPKNSCLI
jgi:hypothetical protein